MTLQEAMQQHEAAATELALELQKLCIGRPFGEVSAALGKLAGGQVVAMNIQGVPLREALNEAMQLLTAALNGALEANARAGNIKAEAPEVLGFLQPAPGDKQ